MPVCSLLTISSKCVAKYYSSTDISGVLYCQLPENAVDILVGHFPIDQIISMELQRNYNNLFTGYWRKIIEKCKVRNFVFQAKLTASFELLAMETFEQPIKSNIVSERQVLLNSLFQEALDLYYYSYGGRKERMPAFALHDALESNFPLINELDWLVLLSLTVNYFNFFPRHTEVFFLNHNLVINLRKSASHVALWLNVTLDNNLTLFKRYYAVLHQFLCDSSIKRFSFHKTNSILQYNKLLQLCLQNYDVELIYQSEVETSYSISTDSNTSNCDIWDNALGEISYCDKDIDCNPPLYSNYLMEQNEMLIPSETHKLHDDYEVLTELELDLEGMIIATSEKDKFISVLSKGYSLTYLAISLTSVMFNEFIDHSIQLAAFAAIDALVSSSDSNLKTLHLINFEISLAKLNELSCSLCKLYEKRKVPFKNFALISCQFIDGKHVQKDAYEWNGCGETIVEKICIENAMFYHDNDETFLNYTHSCLQSFNPLVYSIIGYCSLRTFRLSVNVNLLYSALNLVKSCEIRPIESVIFYLPNHKIPKTEEEKLVKALSNVRLKSFTLFYDSETILFDRVFNILQEITKNAIIIKKNYRRNSDCSVVDFLSQM